MPVLSSFRINLGIKALEHCIDIFHAVIHLEQVAHRCQPRDPIVLLTV
jgi:hypothetical protein